MSGWFTTWKAIVEKLSARLWTRRYPRYASQRNEEEFDARNRRAQEVEEQEAVWINAIEEERDEETTFPTHLSSRIFLVLVLSQGSSFNFFLTCWRAVFFWNYKSSFTSCNLTYLKIYLIRFFMPELPPQTLFDSIQLLFTFDASKRRQLWLSLGSSCQPSTLLKAHAFYRIFISGSINSLLLSSSRSLQILYRFLLYLL